MCRVSDKEDASLLSRLSWLKDNTSEKLKIPIAVAEELYIRNRHKPLNSHVYIENSKKTNSKTDYNERNK